MSAPSRFATAALLLLAIAPAGAEPRFRWEILDGIVQVHATNTEDRDYACDVSFRIGFRLGHRMEEQEMRMPGEQMVVNMGTGMPDVRFVQPPRILCRQAP